MVTMTRNQLEQIARLCVQEQGGSETGVKGEASLMANLARKHGREVYEYVRNSGWFSRAAYWMDNGRATGQQVDWVADVLINGNVTLPPYVDEHDAFGDIVWISTGAVRDRSAYIKDVTVIRNRYGATYTFYCFLHEHSDPFGYTTKPVDGVVDGVVEGVVDGVVEGDGIFLRVGD